jgi:hypothetical protein
MKYWKGRSLEAVIWWSAERGGSLESVMWWGAVSYGEGWVWITREYMKKKSCCLGTWCSLFKWLKFGFSREDFGPLLIHELPALLCPDHCAPDVLISLRKPLLDGSPDYCLLRYPIALLDFLISTHHVYTHAYFLVTWSACIQLAAWLLISAYRMLGCSLIPYLGLSRLIAAWLMPNPLISSLSCIGCCLIPQLSLCSLLLVPNLLISSQSYIGCCLIPYFDLSLP